MLEIPLTEILIKTTIKFQLSFFFQCLSMTVVSSMTGGSSLAVCCYNSVNFKTNLPSQKTDPCSMKEFILSCHGRHVICYPVFFVFFFCILTSMLPYNKFKFLKILWSNGQKLPIDSMKDHVVELTNCAHWEAPSPIHWFSVRFWLF